MSHKDRSIRGSRCEAQRIYNQRRYINKLEKDKVQLQQENQQLKGRINKAIETIEIVLDSYKKSPENALGLNINGLLDLLKGDKE